MRGRTAMYVAVPVLVVMLGFIFVLATSDPGTDRRASSPLIGRPAPAIAGETISGDSYELSAGDGRWTLVNFFATWCTPCIQEHPELVDFAERRGAAGDARVVSVVFDDRVQDVRDFFVSNGGNWPVVADPEGRIAVAYGVARVPESYLVAPDGTVVAKITGGVTASGLDRLLSDAEQARVGAQEDLG